MSIECLTYISDAMASLHLPYKFMEWKKKPPGTYFVGEYQEAESMTKEENGYQEAAFILTGFTRESWLTLETAKSKIEKHLPITAIPGNGSRIAVFYGNAFPVPTGDEVLKKIQINLTIKEWRT